MHGLHRGFSPASLSFEILIATDQFFGQLAVYIQLLTPETLASILVAGGRSESVGIN